MGYFQFELRPSKGIHRLSVVAGAAIAVGLSSCTANNPPPQAESPQGESTANADGLQVMTTFLPITQFTKAVAGDRAMVTQLLPTQVGPHDYQAKPEDVQRLTQADVLVKNGLEMEEFLGDLLANAANPNLKVVDSSQGVATIANQDTDEHNQAKGDDHDHDHDHNHDNHDHDKSSEAGHHHHGQYNPHIWLDPKRAIEQVENIRDGLIAADPEGEAEYSANAAAYISQLQALDTDITAALQPYQGKTFVAFHDFAPYFAQSYGLKAVFLVDIPEGNPTPADVKRVTDEVKASNLKTILTEPQAGKSSFSALAKDLGVQISTFDPMETGGTEALQPEYYLTTLRNNVQTLVTAFGGQTQSIVPFWLVRTLAIVPQPVWMKF